MVPQLLIPQCMIFSRGLVFRYNTLMGSQGVHYNHLKSKWLARRRTLSAKLWEKHTDVLTWFQKSSQNLIAGSMAAAVMLASPLITSTFSQGVSATTQAIEAFDKKGQLMGELAKV